MAHENVHRFRFGSWARVISLNLTYERKFQSDNNNNKKKTFCKFFYHSSTTYVNYTIHSSYTIIFLCV